MKKSKNLEKKISSNKRSLSRLFYNNRFLFFFSLFIAIILWGYISLAVYPNDSVVISGVPVSINLKQTAADQLGLSVIDGGDQIVDLVIEGKRYLVGKLTPNDFRISAQLGNVTEAGTFDLSLNITKVNENADYDVVSYSPEKIKVTFDRVETKILTIETKVTGVTVPQGYFMEQSYISPAEIEVTGPQSVINKIEYAAVTVDIGSELKSTQNLEGDIVLLDKDRKTVESKYLTLSRTRANVTIPILKRKNLPFVVQFTDIPPNIDIKKFSYTINPKSVELAGPPETIDALNNISLGPISFKDIGPEGKFEFDLPLLTGFKDLQNVGKVTVSLNTTNLGDRLFTVTDFRLKNVPEGINVKVATEKIENVRVIGNKYNIPYLTNKNVYGIIDFKDKELAQGESEIEVMLTVDKEGYWVYGSYKVIVEISEK